MRLSSGETGFENAPIPISRNTSVRRLSVDVELYDSRFGIT